MGRPTFGPSAPDARTRKRLPRQGSSDVTAGNLHGLVDDPLRGPAIETRTQTLVGSDSHVALGKAAPDENAKRDAESSQRCISESEIPTRNLDLFLEADPYP